MGFVGTSAVVGGSGVGLVGVDVVVMVVGGGKATVKATRGQVIILILLVH